MHGMHVCAQVVVHLARKVAVHVRLHEDRSGTAAFTGYDTR